jgi:hypothetical protein
MPVRKHYECVDTINTIKLGYNYSHLVLIIEKDGKQPINIKLDKHDLTEMIKDLQSINEILYENEKGGKNG